MLVTRSAPSPGVGTRDRQRGLINDREPTRARRPTEYRLGRTLTHSLRPGGLPTPAPFAGVASLSLTVDRRETVRAHTGRCREFRPAARAAVGIDWHHAAMDHRRGKSFVGEVLLPVRARRLVLSLVDEIVGLVLRALLRSPVPGSIPCVLPLYLNPLQAPFDAPALQ